MSSLTVKSGPQTWTGLDHDYYIHSTWWYPAASYSGSPQCGGLVGFTDTQPSILPGIFLVMQCAFKVLMIPKSCNSFYISHFAAFFIVVGAKKSIAESCITLVMIEVGEQLHRRTQCVPGNRPAPISFDFWFVFVYLNLVVGSVGAVYLRNTSLPTLLVQTYTRRGHLLSPIYI